jgi:hypothetical protein
MQTADIAQYRGQDAPVAIWFRGKQSQSLLLQPVTVPQSSALYAVQYTGGDLATHQVHVSTEATGRSSHLCSQDASVMTASQWHHRLCPALLQCCLSRLHQWHASDLSHARFQCRPSHHHRDST